VRGEERMKKLLAAILLAAACSAPQPLPEDAGAEPDAAVPDAGSPEDAGAESDAGTEVPDAGPVTATVFPRVGAASDSQLTPNGPGLILGGGGTDVDAEFVWMRQQLSTDASTRLGDVVVLRASGADGYTQYIYDLAPFNSVQTVLLPPPSTLADLRLAAGLVDRAEAVFFAGGDQSRYAAWAGTELMAAVQRVYNRGGVVGGTSAGLAMLGEYVYDARTGSATSAEALANPYAASISFTRGALSFPFLAGAITDSHFRPRDRFGRLAAFMARQQAASILGIGVDEQTAVVVDKTGRATLLRQGASTGAAYFVAGGMATQLQAGQPLVYPGLTVLRLDAAGQYYDLVRRCGTGRSYAVSVDARQPDPYGGVNPYTAAGVTGTCP
jgi:cyanophycinase